MARVRAERERERSGAKAVPSGGLHLNIDNVDTNLGHRD